MTATLNSPKAWYQGASDTSRPLAAAYACTSSARVNAPGSAVTPSPSVRNTGASPASTQ
jgi:hypothetical protein